MVPGDYNFEYLNDSIVDVTISQNFANLESGQYFMDNSMLGAKSYHYEYVLNPFSQQYDFFSGNEHLVVPEFSRPGDNYQTIQYEHSVIIQQTDTLMEIDLGHKLDHGQFTRLSDSSIIYLKKV